jgi:hypothetical protein
VPAPTPAPEQRYRADCGRCRGLCCIVFGHLPANGFPADKSPDRPCRHLRPDYRCGVFPTLETEGYTVCRAYDCRGAGPLVSAWIDADGLGRSPNDTVEDTVAAADRLEDFRQLSRLHILLAAAPRKAGADAAWLCRALDAVSLRYERTGQFEISDDARAALRRNEGLIADLLGQLDRQG